MPQSNYNTIPSLGAELPRAVVRAELEFAADKLVAAYPNLVVADGDGRISKFNASLSYAAGVSDGRQQPGIGADIPQEARDQRIDRLLAQIRAIQNGSR